MRRHRSGAPEQEESSSDEEDAFAKMPSRKNKRAKIKEEPTDEPSAATRAKIKEEPKDEPSATTQSAASNTTTMPPSQQNNPALSATVTSSMKRHHSVSSDARKAKMDALLMELEEAKHNTRKTPYSRGESKGSFVEHDEEHVTTNIFVGNLPSSMTEERLTNLFEQFGETLLVLKLCDCRVMLQ
jgi:RNA recognition motif-containing protein